MYGYLNNRDTRDPWIKQKHCTRVSLIQFQKPLNGDISVSIHFKFKYNSLGIFIDSLKVQTSFPGWHGPPW